MGVPLCNLMSLVVFGGNAAPEVSMGCISLLGVWCVAEIRGASTGTWCEPGVFDSGHCLLGSGVRAQGSGTGALREFGSSIGWWGGEVQT